MLLLLITGADDGWRHTVCTEDTQSMLNPRDGVEDVFVGLLQPRHRDPLQEEKSSFLPQ